MAPSPDSVPEHAGSTTRRRQQRPHAADLSPQIIRAQGPAGDVRAAAGGLRLAHGMESRRGTPRQAHGHAILRGHRRRFRRAARVAACDGRHQPRRPHRLHARLDEAQAQGPGQQQQEDEASRGHGPEARARRRPGTSPGVVWLGVLGGLGAFLAAWPRR